jgi:hypothetical protein
MKRYDVTYYLSRTVTITVDVPNGGDVHEYADIDILDGESITDIDISEVDHDTD